MSTTCPYCDLAGDRQAVHRHLAETHGDRVHLRTDADLGDRFYRVECPACGAPWERQIKPRGRDEAFLQEFDLQIKLVAFDMLLHHMSGEHAGEEPGENGAVPLERGGGS